MRVIYCSDFSSCAFLLGIGSTATQFESLPLRKTTKQKGIEKSIPFVFVATETRLIGLIPFFRGHTDKDSGVIP